MTLDDHQKPYTLRASHLITPEERHSPGWLRIEGGKIAGVGAGEPAGEARDLGDVTLAPGFIDLHVHGGGGYSLTGGDPMDVAAFARWAPSTGVTSFLATVVASDVEEGERCLQAIAQARDAPGLVGVNLEGPFLNPERRGAIPGSWISPPDTSLFDRLHQAGDGMLRVMTVAPEMPGAEGVIELALRRGVVVSAGHTDATYAEALRAFQAGASHLTHALNAMRPFHQREPGTIGAALDSDGVTIEVIADGVHLHPSAVRLLVRSFGTERVALVTDGIPHAGAGEGTFEIGGAAAEVRDGRALLPDGTIAGSVVTMDRAVRNAVDWSICGLAEAVGMASTVPARVAGLGERKGHLAAGCDADVIAIDGSGSVVATWQCGRPVSR